MSAQEKVLGIPELVENIIASMAPEDIPMATRVCKMWNEQVLRSKSVLLASCLRPKYSCMKDITIPEYLGDIKFIELMPCYEFSHRLRIHSTLATPSKGSKIHFGNGALYEVSIRGDCATLRDSPEVQAIRNQHATQPPTTQILIGVGGMIMSSYGPLTIEVACTVRNEQGVTVGEVLDASHGIYTTGDWMKSSGRYYQNEACFRVWDSSRDVHHGKERYE